LHLTLCIKSGARFFWRPATELEKLRCLVGDHDVQVGPEKTPVPASPSSSRYSSVTGELFQCIKKNSRRQKPLRKQTGAKMPEPTPKKWAIFEGPLREDDPLLRMSFVVTHRNDPFPDFKVVCGPAQGRSLATGSCFDVRAVREVL
jgi:hypothetical protein